MEAGEDSLMSWRTPGRLRAVRGGSYTKRGSMKIKKRKKRSYKKSDINRCCWCGLQISEDVPVVVLHAKIKESFREKMIKRDGYIMPLTLHSLGKTMLAAIAGKNSEAELAGDDIAFLCCGKRCGEELKSAVDNELDIFSDVNFG